MVFNIDTGILVMAPVESLKYPEAHNFLVAVQQEVATEVAVYPINCLIIDLKNVEYVDFTGLTTLFAIKDLLAQHTGLVIPIHFVNAKSQHMNRLVQVTTHVPGSLVEVGGRIVATNVSAPHTTSPGSPLPSEDSDLTSPISSGPSSARESIQTIRSNRSSMQPNQPPSGTQSSASQKDSDATAQPAPAMSRTRSFLNKRDSVATLIAKEIESDTKAHDVTRNNSMTRTNSIGMLIKKIRTSMRLPSKNEIEGQEIRAKRPSNASIQAVESASLDNEFDKYFHSSLEEAVFAVTVMD
ncbi:hypothetical protein HDU79_006779 [Rhizoclosmatium sp. JEL0117]|nr:hypothetical protein HDU79_006779 [Rhizoclosmatium sp. JEL0117]